MLTVLWDNDGVLVDTEGLYFEATQTVLRSVGIEMTLEQFKEISLRRGESTLQLAAEQGVAADRISELRADRDRVYAAMVGAGSRVIDGVEQALRTLHGRVRMGIVTSSRRDHFEMAHARSGLLPYFDFILTREDYPRAKPHPDPYLAAMQQHDLQPDSCVIIEDSERGLASAVAAGVPCLVVLSKLTRDGDFARAAAVLDNVSDVPTEIFRRASIQRTD